MQSVFNVALVWYWECYRVCGILECAVQCRLVTWQILAKWVVWKAWRLCQSLTHEAQVAILGHRAVWILHFATSAVFYTRKTRQVWCRKPWVLSLRSHWEHSPTASKFTRMIILSFLNLPLLTSLTYYLRKTLSSCVKKWILSCPFFEQSLKIWRIKTIQSCKGHLKMVLGGQASQFFIYFYNLYKSHMHVDFTIVSHTLSHHSPFLVNFIHKYVFKSNIH